MWFTAWTLDVSIPSLTLPCEIWISKKGVLKNLWLLLPSRKETNHVAAYSWTNLLSQATSNAWRNPIIDIGPWRQTFETSSGLEAYTPIWWPSLNLARRSACTCLLLMAREIHGYPETIITAIFSSLWPLDFVDLYDLLELVPRGTLELFINTFDELCEILFCYTR